MNKSQIITKWSIQDSPVFSSSDDPMVSSLKIGCNNLHGILVLRVNGGFK